MFLRETDYDVAILGKHFYVELPLKEIMLIGTIHKICKVRGSNPGHYQKKNTDTLCLYIWFFIAL